MVPLQSLTLAASVDGIPGRNVRVYLPPGYPSTRDHYPVLYMQDGQNVFSPGGPFGCWMAEQTAEAEIISGHIPPFIMVAIDNDGLNRRREYVPPGDAYRDTGPGLGDQYAAFVIRDVMPLINRTFRTRIGPEHTAIAGSSLGGVISLYLGHETNAFGIVGSMSTAICWATHYVQSLAMRPKQALRIYHDVGTRESVDMAPDNYWEDNLALQDLFTRKGYQAEHELKFVVAKDAHHREADWAQRFPALLHWMWGDHG